MFGGLFYTAIAVIISLIMLVPFGFATMYVLLSVKQLVTADKEKNKLKKEGGIKSLLQALMAMLLILVLWLYIMSKFE